MMRHTISFYVLVICGYWVPSSVVFSQCPLFTGSSVAGAGSPLCEGASVLLSATAQDIPPGSFLDWYIGTNSIYDPYTGQGNLIGSIPIELTCNNAPEVLYIMVNPDNALVGGPDDRCDEFLVLWTGSGGFSTTDISVTNLGNGSFFWNDFVVGNAGSFSCGISLLPGPVPPNSILIIQGSPSNNVLIDIDNLCASGLPVYIIANNNFDCTGGFFDNDSPCSSCPVHIDINGAGCVSAIDVDYSPPAPNPINGWGWSNTGSGVFGDVVPVVNIPMYLPDETIIDDFIWTIPDDFCEAMEGGNWFITGVLQPPPSGICPDIFTQYFLLNISCPQLIFSGGGDVCIGSCPDNPTEINFEIIGDDVPYTADLIVSISILPDLPINNLEIFDGQKIYVCMDGMFPSFDPATGILHVPEIAIGITATVQVLSLISASGCQVALDPDFIVLNFIDAPTSDAGNDVTICPGEMVVLEGVLGGSATIALWTTNGDGIFLEPSDPGTSYSPGPLDILNGSVELTLSSMDANGSCIPAESTIFIFFEPAIMIDLGPPQTVCDNDVVNLSVMMTGGSASGEWISGGDGEFDDPFNVNTFYTPGTGDLNNDVITISYDVTDPDACIGTNEPLIVTLVAAPQVTIPQDVEICDDESVTIQIGIEGSFTNVTWSSLGDGQLNIINTMEVMYTPGANDIAEGIVIITVTVESVFDECGQTTYTIPVTITLCNCPAFETSAPTMPLCAGNDALDLSTLIIAAPAGEWSITVMPTGSNPATIVGSVLMTNNSDPGSYTVTYVLDTPQTGCPFSSNETVDVVSVIVPDAGPDITNCGPGAIAIIGQPSPAFPASVLWETLGDGLFTNPTAQATIYTPGNTDSISSVIRLVFHILDPVCGNQSDSLNIFFNEPAFAIFPNDTFTICNEFDNGSVINFPALIFGGDDMGTWTNTGGAPVNFSDPASVDFDGVPEGYYTFMYQTISAILPCQNATYTIVIFVEDCLCPILINQSPPGGICNSQLSLALNAFIMAGAPGTWMMLNVPPGSNPATIGGNFLQIQGADPGIYKLRFTFDAAPLVGCPDSTEIEVLIQDVPGISVSPDTTVCGAGSILLHAGINGSAINAGWMTSGSGVFNSSTNLHPIYTPSVDDLISGQVQLVAFTIDTLGFCVPASDTMLLTLLNPPFTNWSSLTTTICNQPDSGSVVDLISFITGGDANGLWSDIDGSLVDLTDPANVDFNGIPPGNYHYSYLTQSATSPCQDIMYTFNVQVEDCSCPLMTENISDTILLCPGDTFLLIPIVTGAQGLAFSTWISDVTLMKPSLSLFKAGTWIWIVRDSSGCERRDTFDVNLRELIEVDVDSVPPTCEGHQDGLIIIKHIQGGLGPYSVQFDGSPPFISSIWPDTITNIGVGLHTLIVSNLDGCESMFSVMIDDVSTGNVELGPDINIELGDSVWIDPEFINIQVAQVLWDPNIPGTGTGPFWIMPDSTLLISVVVTDSSGCTYEDDILITVTVDRKFYIPTIFSPNGDQINDILRIETSTNPIDILSLEIYDRWGNQIYGQYASPPFQWDGACKSKTAMPGVYVMKLIWRDDTGNEHMYISDLTLIR